MDKGRMSVKALLLHLRLNWQLMLMPIFLWGFFLSGGEVDARFWVVLFVFHVLFYGGSTAFNSYYDQDEGPVGGLWSPPRPTRALLVFSLCLQFIGLIVVAGLGHMPLLVLSFVMFGLSVAYSHPVVRLKSRPWASLLAVSVGQGVGGSMAGWLVGRADWTSLFDPKALLGVAAATLITTGFYPLTQLYQREEDRRRGDITFAVVWGERCFLFSIICMVAAGLLGGVLVAYYYSFWEGALVGAVLFALAALIWGWWRQFDERELKGNYSRMMRIGYLMGIGFSLYVGVHLV